MPSRNPTPPPGLAASRWAPKKPSRPQLPTFTTFITTLKKIPVTSLPAGDEECPICTEHFCSPDYCNNVRHYVFPAICEEEDSEKGFKLTVHEEPVKLACGHVFGSHCLVLWFVDEVKDSCPLCRRKMFREE
jgi:hypothetical protein